MKKLSFLVLFLIPGIAHADRFGSIKSSSDVSLSSNTILNQSTIQSGKTFYVEGSTVSGNGLVVRSTFTGGMPLQLYFHASLTGDQLFIPLNYNVGFGDNILSYLGYNTGGTAGTSGWTFSDASKNEVVKIQTDGNNINGIGVAAAGTSGTMRVKNTIDDTGSLGVPTSSTTVSLTLATTHFLMLVDATAGPLTITFPELNPTTSNGGERRWYKLCRIDNSGNAISLVATGDDVFAENDTLDNKGDCMDFIGTVQGPSTVGTWRQVSKTVWGGITGNLNVTGYVHASGVIASEAGTYAFAGTTITFAAPTIDTNDRIPTLNNGSVTWNLAITDAMRKDHYSAVTSSTNWVANSTIQVQGIMLDKNNTSGTSGQVWTSNGAGVSPTWQAASGSGSGSNIYPATATPNFQFGVLATTGVFTGTVNLSTNSEINVSTVGFSGGYDSNSNPWYAVPSSFTAVYSGAAGQTFSGTSSVTVNGLQYWAPANSTTTGTFDLYMNNSSSNSGGYKFSMIGPASPVYFEMTGGGSGASATTANLAQQASALNTKTGTFIGAYTSNPAWFHFGFQLINGTTAGWVNVQIEPATGAGTNTINSESQMTVMMRR